MASPLDNGSLVKELYGDLARKYRIHGHEIESSWLGFTEIQRIEAVRRGAANRVVLKHRNDASLGVVYKLIPEWNLKDLTEAGTTYLTDLFRYRANTALTQQYRGGHELNHANGDYGQIFEMQATMDLRHKDEARFRDCYTFFMDDAENYGRSIAIQREHESVVAGLAPAIQAGVCVPQATGELILQRQILLLQALNIVVEDIIDIGRPGISSARKRARQDAGALAITRNQPSSHVADRPATLSLPELTNTAKDQMIALRDYSESLSDEPTLLSRVVNITFFSRPELVADERGRRLPMHTDRYISPSLFDAVRQNLKATAAWSYISHLLQLLQNSADKAHRSIIMQEISNTCHMEYGRTQALLKRQLQTGLGGKYFQRISHSHVNGETRTTMKVPPEQLTRADPQLHYLLRLCQAETNAAKAVGWMEKLGQLYDAHPDERDRLSEREFDGICDHAIVITFIRNLSSSIVLPNISHRNGQLFVSRSQKLEAMLNTLRDHIDLSDFVVPIDNLQQRDMAQGALQALEQAVVRSTGANLARLYEVMTEDCLQDLEKQYHQVNATAKVQAKQVYQATSAPACLTSTEWPPEAHKEQRKQKEKTRPAHSLSSASVTPLENDAAAGIGIAEKTKPLKVKTSTMAVFQALFSRAESRGPVSWDGFTTAMADVGFSVIPKFGSIYTFSPREFLDLNQSLTLHRPHKSIIEPWLLIVFAQRLRRRYGWTVDSFTTA